MEKLYLPHSTGCFICGEENPKGLKHKFYVLDKEVRCDVFIPKNYNGFKNVVHGGIVTALLDETMGWNAFVFGSTNSLCFTRSLEVKFKKNAPTETELTVVTHLKSEKRGMFEAEGKIIDAEGNVYAAASGFFVPVPKNKMQETTGYMKMNDGLNYHPKYLEIFGECVK